MSGTLVEELPKGLREEYENIKANQPVFPGDVISHNQAYALVQYGLVTRDAAGDFILVGGAK